MAAGSVLQSGSHGPAAIKVSFIVRPKMVLNLERRA
jgi:hypothetical protein